MRTAIVCFSLLLVPFLGLCKEHKKDSAFALLKKQKEDTAKVNLLNELSASTAEAGYDPISDSLNRLAIALAEKLNYKKGIAEAYLNNGVIIASKGDFDKAMPIMTKGLMILQELGNKKDVGFANVTIATVYGMAGRGEESLDYFKKALPLFKDINYKEGIALCYNGMGNDYTELGNYPEALISYRNGLVINQELGNKENTLEAYNNIGMIYDMESDYPAALKYYLLSLGISEEMQNNSYIGNAYVNIGEVYDQLHNYDEAIKNDSLAIKANEKIGFKPGIALSYGSLGTVFEDKGNYKEALNCLLKATKMDEEIHRMPDLASDYGNAANVYYEMGEYGEALKSVSKSQAIAYEIDFKNCLANTFITLGKVNTKLKKYNDARADLDSAIKFSRDIHANDITRDTYLARTSLDSAQNDYGAAYKDYKVYIQYRDSLNNEANTKKIITEQMQYDFDKKQAQEKAEQEKKDAIHNEQVKKQRIFIYSVSIGFVLVLLLALVIFRSLKQNRKKTQIILEQKLEVEKKNLVIEQQKNLVEEKNKSILDSITYAKRLQDAILPPISSIKSHLPESFVLYKPKDIVAGDFYWMAAPLNIPEGETNGLEPSFGVYTGGQTLFIAACDCTGHGVPGAMVSVVCSNALNRAVKEFKLRDTGAILDKVRELVLETFSQAGPMGEMQGDVKDGMDISLCAINSKAGEVQWSGAYNPLWYINDGEFKDISADKQPVGKHDIVKPFSSHTIKLNKGDMLYLFTDGYADQFGGPKGKKFKYQQLKEKLMSISSQHVEEQKNILADIFENWKGDLEQTDDVCIIGIRV